MGVVCIRILFDHRDYHNVHPFTPVRNTCRLNIKKAPHFNSDPGNIFNIILLPTHCPPLSPLTTTVTVCFIQALVKHSISNLNGFFSPHPKPQYPDKAGPLPKGYIRHNSKLDNAGQWCDPYSFKRVGINKEI